MTPFQRPADEPPAIIHVSSMLDLQLAKSVGAPLEVITEGCRQEFARIFSMTRAQERESLYAVARYAYTGEGDIWDLGCAAGGSSYFLACGLRDRNDKEPLPTIKCFDIFNGSSRYLLKQYFPNASDDIELFREHTRPVKDYLTPVKLDLTKDLASFGEGRAVEIAHIDAAKSLDLWTAIFSKLCKNIIPGKTIWIFQDFERARTPWHVYSLWDLLPFGDIIGGAAYGTVYFRFREPPSQAVFRRIAADELTLPERVHNVRRMFAHVRTHHRSFFPDSIYLLDDVETASVAYCHYWQGEQDRSREIFLETTDAYRAIASNRIYSSEILGA
jgi:hypothetical protein